MAILADVEDVYSIKQFKYYYYTINGKALNRPNMLSYMHSQGKRIGHAVI